MTRDIPTPPRRPPILNDAFAGTENVPPRETPMTLCHRLSFALGYDGPWVVGGWQISLVEVRRAEYTDPLEADFRIVPAAGEDAREMGARFASTCIPPAGSRRA